MTFTNVVDKLRNPVVWVPAVMLLTIAGLLAHRLGWTPLLKQSCFAGLVAFVLYTAGAVSKRLLGIKRTSGAVVISVILGLLYFCGFPEFIALVICTLGCMAIGSLLMSDPVDGPPEIAEVISSWVAGAGVLAGVIGWLSPLPLHHPAVWGAGLLTLGFLKRRAIARSISEVAAWHESETASIPVWMLTVAGFTFIFVCAAVWMPVRNSDDLRFHLIVANDFLQHGRGMFDIGAQSWAMSPWAGDMLSALVALLSGESKYIPFNLAWLAASAMLVRVLALSVGATAVSAMLGVVLFLSIPLTGFLAGSLQTELPTITGILAIATLIHRQSASGNSRSRRLLLVAGISGLLLGLKISNLIFLAPFFVWMLLQWRPLPSLRLLGASILVFSVASLSSYVYAMLLTGNPVFPLYNALFGSPWYPHENFADGRWSGGIKWTWAWDATFRTEEFFEGQGGAAGFALMFLAVGGMLALTVKTTRAVSLVALSSIAIFFIQTRYIRYPFPGIVLLIPVTMRMLSQEKSPSKWIIGAVVSLSLVQIAAWASASWIYSNGGLKILVTQGRDAFYARFVPEELLLNRTKTAETDRILLADPNRDYIGLRPSVLIGRGWTAPIISKFNGDETSSTTWENIVERTGANYILVYDAQRHPGLLSYLGKNGASEMDSEGVVSLFRLHPQHVSTAVGETVNTITLNYAYPIVGRIDYRVLCDAPGKIVVVNWTLEIDNMGRKTSSEWKSCGISGDIDASVYIHVGQRTTGRLVLSVAPRPEDPVKVALGASRVDLRRDFSSETALANQVFIPGCGFDCKVMQASMHSTNSVVPDVDEFSESRKANEGVESGG